MSKARARDERGATAIIVALLGTFLTGVVAFTTDFGIAYANNRSLQTVADAAALGAAGVFAEQQERQCADIRSAGMSDAVAEANDKVAQNAAGTSATSLQSFTASCENGDLVIRVIVTTESPNIFGKALGRTADYALQRAAATVVEAGTTGPRLRPLALCASDLGSTVAPGSAFRLYAPGDGLAPAGSCPLPPNPGNWWTLDCPNEGSDDGNGTSALVDQIRNGCSSPVSIVPGQGSLSGVALNTHLAAACPSPSTTAPYTCLGGDPGQPDAGQAEAAWKDLINAGTSVPIPVFCSPSPGRCATSSVVGTGTNAIFPVHKLIGVQVCGYHFGKQVNRRYRAPASVTSCGDASSELALMMNDGQDDIYLVMVLRNAQISNVTGDSGCDLGDDLCDGGLRQVRMVSGGFSY